MSTSFPTRPFLRSRRGQSIRTLQEWQTRRDAVNMGWVEGKSAWEIANAWVGTGEPRVPPEFQALLESHALTKRAVVRWGIVEHRTHLKFGPSGPRNHDLALCCRIGRSRIIVGMESKADDGFDKSMRERLDEAAQIQQIGKNTNLHLRVDWLSQSLLGQQLRFGEQKNDDDEQVRIVKEDILDLPYQLFAAVAGTLLEAKMCRASAAVFVVHQFRTRWTNDSNIRRDAKLYNRFVQRLFHANLDSKAEMVSLPLEDGRLFGPIHFATRDCGTQRWNLPSGIPLLVGKVTTDRTL